MRSRTANPPDLVATRRRLLPGLALLTLLAGALRFWRLGEWSVWIDETYSITDAMSGAGWWNLPATNFPIGLWGIRGSLEAFGQVNEWTARFFPACAGTLAPAVLAWALACVLGNRRALAAGLFLAVHPWHVQWSQNARAYAPMVLFLILFAPS